MSDSEIRDIDYDLKMAIRDFLYTEYYGVMINYPDDFIKDLEDYLKERKFDLGCVVQYK